MDNQVIAMQGDDTSPAVKTEVVARTQRRRFIAEHKLRILEESDRCKEPGEIGALRRRDGLYSQLSRSGGASAMRVPERPWARSGDAKLQIPSTGR